MNSARRTTALALEFARRRRGITAGELAEAASLTPRGAQGALAALVADGFLTVEVPPRKGQPRGSWRNIYRIAKGGTR
jgi:predicted ArsR family transcriptional regulator